MIKNVLIPEKIGNYYLFAKRIVGFHVDASEVTATQVYLKGSFATVEKVFKESIGFDEELSYEEKVSQVVKNILGKVGKYDAVYTAMPSSQVIFKNLKLPFLNYEKIKMVVGYEVEPLLPFALDEAEVDFIITKQFPKEGSSEILVAAVQKSVLADHISFFEQVGVHPQKVGVDFFEFYGLFKTISRYKKLKGAIGLVDIGLGSTRVAFIQDSQLKAIRVLPKGMNNFIEAVSGSNKISFEDARNAISTFGLSKEQDELYHSALTDSLKSFWSSVQFTLGSFAYQGKDLEFKKFFLSGTGSTIAKIQDFVSDQTSISCDQFQITLLFSDNQIKIKKGVSIQAGHATSLGVSLPSKTTEQFNLLPLEMSTQKDISILTKQLAVACVFVFAIIASLLVHNFFQIRKLKNEIRSSEEDVIVVLKDRFDISRDEQDFDKVVEDAENVVAKEESLWAPFSAQSNFLKYLLELHALDTEGLGLKIERLAIAKNIMTLKARVKDFPSVIKLEKELRKSKLFRYEGSVQKTDFTMQIPLAKNG